MGNRTEKEWENKFECVKRFMSVMDSLSDDYGKDSDIVVTCATMLRNPIVFDNNLKEVKNNLPYHIENMECETEDHLIGISNIVLYIHKNGIHKKWVTVDDFKKTLKALNILLPVTKSLNSCGVFKNGWKFEYDTIEDCIDWDVKLVSVGITSLICNETNKKHSVKEVRDKWYNQNKKFLN